MKFNRKIALQLSTLLVAITACYAQAGEVATPQPSDSVAGHAGFHITNKAGVTIYGSIYKTSSSGKVVGAEAQDPIFFEVQNTECFNKAVLRSKKRTSEFHRIIFATSEYALKRKLIDAINSPKVVSTLIPQNIFSNMFSTKSTYCYSITLSSNKLRIKPSGSEDQCTPCAEPLVNVRSTNRSKKLSQVHSSQKDREEEQSQQTTLQKIKGVFKSKPKQTKQSLPASAEPSQVEPMWPEAAGWS